MFQNNPIERILRFLDEAGSLAENLRLIATLPQVPVNRSWVWAWWR